MPNLLELGNSLFNPAFRARVVGALFLVISKMLANPNIGEDDKRFLSAASRVVVHIAETILPKVLSYPGVAEKLEGADTEQLDNKILEAVEAVLLDFKDLKLE